VSLPKKLVVLLVIGLLALVFWEAILEVFKALLVAVAIALIAIVFLSVLPGFGFVFRSLLFWSFRLAGMIIGGILSFLFGISLGRKSYRSSSELTSEGGLRPRGIKGQSYR